MSEEKIMYLENGQEVELHTELKDGYLVNYLYYDEDDEPFVPEVNPVFVKKLFKSPPLAVFNEKVSAIKDEIAT